MNLEEAYAILEKASQIKEDMYARPVYVVPSRTLGWKNTWNHSMTDTIREGDFHKVVKISSGNMGVQLGDGFAYPWFCLEIEHDHRTFDSDGDDAEVEEAYREMAKNAEIKAGDKVVIKRRFAENECGFYGCEWDDDYEKALGKKCVVESVDDDGIIVIDSNPDGPEPLLEMPFFVLSVVEHAKSDGKDEKQKDADMSPEVKKALKDAFEDIVEQKKLFDTGVDVIVTCGVHGHTLVHSFDWKSIKTDCGCEFVMRDGKMVKAEEKKDGETDDF